MQRETIVIDARYCGPPRSGNGGYTAGRLAAFLADGAEVTLRRPPPLARPLALRRRPDGAVELYDADSLVATAVAAMPEPVTWPAPTIAQAARAAARTFDASRHALPGCFVCGPGRAPGDGLRLQVGPVTAGAAGWCGVLAAPWTPAAEFADAAGLLRPEFVWAALDCPSAYACASPEGMPPILLGRQTVAVRRLPMAGETLVVAARRRGREGRKYFSDAALFAADGRQLAAGNSLWIEVSPDVLRGAA